jgi:hypothetical protein
MAGVERLVLSQLQELSDARARWVALLTELRSAHIAEFRQLAVRLAALAYLDAHGGGAAKELAEPVDVAAQQSASPFLAHVLQARADVRNVLASAADALSASSFTGQTLWTLLLECGAHHDGARGRDLVASPGRRLIWRWSDESGVLRRLFGWFRSGSDSAGDRESQTPAQSSSQTDAASTAAKSSSSTRPGAEMSPASARLEEAAAPVDGSCFLNGTDARWVDPDHAYLLTAAAAATAADADADTASASASADTAPASHASAAAPSWQLLSRVVTAGPLRQGQFLLSVEAGDIARVIDRDGRYATSFASPLSRYVGPRWGFRGGCVPSGYCTSAAVGVLLRALGVDSPDDGDEETPAKPTQTQTQTTAASSSSSTSTGTASATATPATGPAVPAAEVPPLAADSHIPHLRAAVSSW